MRTHSLFISDEVLQHEVHRVARVPALALERRARVRQQRLAGLAEVRAQKQAVDGMLHAGVSTKSFSTSFAAPSPLLT